MFEVDRNLFRTPPFTNPRESPCTRSQEMSRGFEYGVNETSTETSRTQCDSGACVHVEEEGTYSHSGSEERSSESAV